MLAGDDTCTSDGEYNSEDEYDDGDMYSDEERDDDNEFGPGAGRRRTPSPSGAMDAAVSPLGGGAAGGRPAAVAVPRVAVRLGGRHAGVLAKPRHFR
jgi:hypothetical protein